ncbi:ABC transporter substrate-binding protein [Mesorhizobium sp. B1-1-8]|uniref:ABC transporter substrate-binding protein n=1 Tax=Mesorhizobium sp. B1-1-8 TaxID=2589976 RepID=UPI001128B81B|nr:extracellular solute-binding protein [Mesorhizobium sp. B1-1-8]UCI08235.1 extracellular solute-binding protein [Mesorhizobium sp. B1-1-8]
MNIRTTLGLALGLTAMSMAAPASAADLVLYDALDFAGPVAKAFQAKTGLTVDVVEPGSTGETLGKIAAEGKNPQFDIVWIDGSAVMERMAADHVLQPVPADEYDKVAFTDLGKSLVPQSHAFLPTGTSTTAIEVNTKKVEPGKLPKSWADLEAFAGSVAAKDPNLSGPAYQWLAGFFQTNGVDAGKALLAKTLTNKSLSGLSSGGKINKAVLTGDAAVGINQDSAIFAKIAAGEPVIAVYPSEGSVSLPQGLGISAKTQHMDAVRKFIEFVTSADGQAAMQNGDDTDYFFIPIIKGVNAKPGRETNITCTHLDDAVASAHESEWKQWYKDKFVQ